MSYGVGMLGAMVSPGIAAFSETQHGLVTRGQALTLMTIRQLEYLVASGRLRRVRRGVFVVAGCPATWHQDVLGACLAAGSKAVASFRAAAALWALDGFSEGPLEITVPGRQRRRLPGVIVHDSQVTGPGHLAVVDNVPVTSVARTVCDLTAVVPWWRVRRALADARRRELVTVRELERELEGFAPGGSDPEVDVCRWLVAAGLPRPVQQHQINLGTRTIHIDAAYPDLKIAIEYDGWGWHRGRKPFDDDRERDNELEVRGWMTLRFTSAWSRTKVVDTVRSAIARRTTEQASPDGARQAMQSAPKRMRSSA